jgi:hypothetical protein
VLVIFLQLAILPFTLEKTCDTSNTVKSIPIFKHESLRFLKPAQGARLVGVDEVGQKTQLI